MNDFIGRLLFVLIALIYMGSCAPAKSYVRKTYAYSLVRFMGNIPVDDNGTPLSSGVDTSYMIYLETAPRTSIVWNSGQIGNKLYHVQPTQVLERSMVIGYDKMQEQPIVIKAADGNELWQLLFVPQSLAGVTPVPSDQQTIILQGSRKKKNITVRINDLVELKPVQGL